MKAVEPVGVEYRHAAGFDKDLDEAAPITPEIEAALSPILRDRHDRLAQVRVRD